MRQLDLFNSLFDPPPAEDKPDEKNAVAKKEEAGIVVAESEVSYNIVGVAADKLLANEGDNDNAEDVNKEKRIAPLPAVLSLFDASLTETLPQSESAPAVIDEDVSPDDGQISNEDAPVHAIEALEDQPLSNPVETTVTISDTPFTGEDLASVDQVISVKEIIVKKKASVTAKNTKAPELERSGSVVFDDGKISVKIKNKSPFPAPIVKPKKEKVKKLPQKRGRKSFKEIDAEVDLIEIPEDEILFQKQYYPISEVAKWFRVNTSLLRFWENEFDVLKPRKNRKGDRLFRPEDVKNLQLIYQLLRQRKYTIEGAKEYIKTNKKKADLQLQLTTTLQKFRSFLLDLKASL